MNKKVYIYSIPRTSAQGLHLNINPTSGKELKMNKVNHLTDTKFTVKYSTKVGGYKTGLYKPWMEDGKQKTSKDGISLTLQDYYEEKYKLPKNYLTNKASDLRMMNPEKDLEKTYFENLVITLKEGCTILDLDVFDDLMRYEVILEDPTIANSEKEWRSHLWPKAEFYIALENEDSELKYTKNLAKTKALAELHNTELTLPLKRQIIVILQIANARTTLTEAQVHNLLYDYIDATTSVQSSNIMKFMNLVEILKTPKGRIEFEARFFLQKCIDYRIISEKQGSYIWNKPLTGVIVIGETYSEAIEFLMNSKKEALIADLKEELKIKE